jgi:GTP-binding protein
MRAERTIRRADLCVLVIDVTSGVTSQDKKIAGLIQESRKPSLVILNKWDLVKPARGAKAAMKELIATAREHLFFLDYAPVLIASAATGENVIQLFDLIADVTRASDVRIGTWRSEPHAARGLRSEPATDDRHAPPEALLRRAVERRL